MKEPSASSDAVRPAVLNISDPAAARLLADASSRRFLSPFMGGEGTVRQAADQLGVHMSSVLYRVRQFLQLGLLHVARIEPRRGRPVRHYRTTAASFFVPFEITPIESPEAVSQHVFTEVRRTLDAGIGAAWLRAIGEDRQLGIHVFAGPDGSMLMDIAVPPDTGLGRPGSSFLTELLQDEAPAVWDSWTTLRLAPADAKALQRDLAQLVRRYRPATARPEAVADYLVRLAMAPLGRD